MRFVPVDPRAEWQQQAACRGEDPEAFFADDKRDLIVAKRICHRCPVQPACLDWATRNPSATEFGIWGGTDKDERRKMRRRARST